ncbi:MAG: hypothetical protein HYW07_06335 [Candidatus Latescibacteria bacterium]|nr:hypothetical protein [Candidatus Latescibacterota bacterium]
MNGAETLLEIFDPPEGMVGQSAALVAMTGTEDFLEAAMQRFTGLRPRQRSELGTVVAYLMLDGHASRSRQNVLPPGRVPGLHELQPRASDPGSLLHAKLALLSFATNRTAGPAHLRLAVLTANYTYTSARKQLELVWTVDVPLDAAAPAEDRADVAAAGAFIAQLIDQRFYDDEKTLPIKQRRLMARLDALREAAKSVAPSNRRPRFIHSLGQPLYEQIRQRLRKSIHSPRNLLLCGSGFYEAPAERAGKPSILTKLEELDVFTAKVQRVVLVEPSEAGAVASWAVKGDTDGWMIAQPSDALGFHRRLHAKFIYVGYLRDDYASKGWLYLGSGNLSRRGLLTSGAMKTGNIECGIVMSVEERFDAGQLERCLFWNPEAEEIDTDEWHMGQVGDAPEAPVLLIAPPILAASIETQPAMFLCLFWRADIPKNATVSINWAGHGWQSVALELGRIPLEGSDDPSVLRVRDDATETDFVKQAQQKEDWAELEPLPDKPEWVLLSHGFRAPQVRQGRSPAEWRVALPSYVRAELSAASRRNDARTRIGKLLDDPNKIIQQIAGRISECLSGRDRQQWRKQIDALLPVYRRGGNNRLLIQALQEESGRQLVEGLLGLWLGEFDLIVIDEAHKSRESATGDGTDSKGGPTKVLPRLLDSILRKAANGRRLCLTATPMELELSQWLDLLKRAGCGVDPARSKEVVQCLHDAARSARVAPDEDARLMELCDAADDFTHTLSSYVTRRRRDDDPLIQKFRLGTGITDGRPHPHRRVEKINIPWSEAVGSGSAWLEVLFAAESMSQSARGLSRADTDGWPSAVRDAYTKLSAGHVSVDLMETNEVIRVPNPGVVDEHTRGKIVRVAYWYRRLRGARQRVVEGAEQLPDVKFDPDSEHPRIIAAVKEIEQWTSQREKVLVFGVYLRPLGLLRDVLNIRHALRAADAGRPVAHTLHTDPELRGIAARQMGHLQEKGELVGRLADTNFTGMLQALQGSHKGYQRLRRQVRESAKKPRHQSSPYMIE